MQTAIEGSVVVVVVVVCLVVRGVTSIERNYFPLFAPVYVRLRLSHCTY